MKARVANNKIIVYDFEEDEYSKTLSLPGARPYKKISAISFPISPFCANRLVETRKIKNSDIEFIEILADYKKIISASKYKQQSVIDNLVGYPPFFLGASTMPRSYQIAASDFCSLMNASYLSMKMGTGKTLVSIMEIIRHDCKNVLVICPKSVIDVWENELEKHAIGYFRHWSIVSLSGSISRVKADWLKIAFDDQAITNKNIIVICNYESVWREPLATEILDREWDMVICDEIHKLKSVSGRASNFAAKLSSKATRRIGMSGTPFPSSILDAFGQFRFLDNGIFGSSFTRFRNRYCRMGGYGGYEVIEYINQDEFMRLFSTISYRVDESVLNLPRINHFYRKFDLSNPAKIKYNEMYKDFITEVNNNIITASNVLSKLLKLQEITSGFIYGENKESYDLGTEKLDTLEEIIDSLEADEKLVIFCRFSHDAGAISALCDKCGRKWGLVTGAQKDTEGGRFPDNLNTLIVQIRAGGLGLNLDAANYGIFYSANFSLGDYEQCISRLHRMGQKKPVFFYHLLARGTVDELIYESLNNKKEIIDAILEYVKNSA